jgi:hypothetical protein
LRAERPPIEIAAIYGAFPGALALPMFEQHGLAGFVLLDSRPDGAHYRPDEVEALGWATLQVGLDLRALGARALRAEAADLRQKLAVRPSRQRSPKITPLKALSADAAA